MSLFFIQHVCHNPACNHQWASKGGIVGTTRMGVPQKECPQCHSEDFGSAPYSFGQLPAPRKTQVFPQENLTIKVYRTTPTAKLPTKAYEDDLGFDLYADTQYYLRTDNGTPHPYLGTPWLIAGESTTRIKTGLQIELPKGYGAIIKPRSCQGSANLDIYAGVKDGGYRGEWIVCVHNSNHNGYYINPGEKVGQFILVKNPQATVVEVQSFGQLSESTARPERIRFVRQMKTTSL